MNIKMYTAAREATTRARNVASAIQQVQRQVNDDNKDIMEKVDKNQQIRSKRKAELELASAATAKRLAQRQLNIANLQAAVATVQTIASVASAIVGKFIDNKDKEPRGSEASAEQRDAENNPAQQTPADTNKPQFKERERAQPRPPSDTPAERANPSNPDVQRDQAINPNGNNPGQQPGQQVASDPEAQARVTALANPGNDAVNQDNAVNAPGQNQPTGQNPQTQPTDQNQVPGQNPQTQPTDQNQQPQVTAQNPQQQPQAEVVQGADGRNLTSSTNSGNATGPGQVPGSANSPENRGTSAQTPEESNPTEAQTPEQSQIERIQAPGKALGDAFRSLGLKKIGGAEQNGPGFLNANPGDGLAGAIAQILVQLIEAARKAAGFEASGGMFEGITKGLGQLGEALTTGSYDTGKKDAQGNAIRKDLNDFGQFLKNGIVDPIQGLASGARDSVAGGLEAASEATTGQGRTVEGASSNALSEQVSEAVGKGSFSSGDEAAFRQAATAALEGGTERLSGQEIQGRVDTAVNGIRAGLIQGVTSGTPGLEVTSSAEGVSVNGVALSDELVSDLTSDNPTTRQQALNTLTQASTSGLLSATSGVQTLGRGGAVTTTQEGASNLGATAVSALQQAGVTNVAAAVPAPTPTDGSAPVATPTDGIQVSIPGAAADGPRQNVTLSGQQLAQIQSAQGLGLQVSVTAGANGAAEVSFNAPGAAAVPGATATPTPGVPLSGDQVQQLAALKAAGVSVTTNNGNVQVGGANGLQFVAGAAGEAATVQSASGTAVNAQNLDALVSVATQAGANGLQGINVTVGADGTVKVGNNAATALNQQAGAIRSATGQSATFSATGVGVAGASGDISRSQQALTAAGQLGLDTTGAQFVGDGVQLRDGRVVTQDSGGNIKIASSSSPTATSLTVNASALRAINGQVNLDQFEGDRLARGVKAGLALADSGAGNLTLNFDANAQSVSGTGGDRNRSVQLSFTPETRDGNGNITATGSASEISLATTGRIASGQATASDLNAIGITNSGTQALVQLAGRGVNVVGAEAPTDAAGDVTQITLKNGVTVSAEAAQGLVSGNLAAQNGARALGSVLAGQTGNFAGLTLAANGDITAPGTGEGTAVNLSAADVSAINQGGERGAALISQTRARTRPADTALPATQGQTIANQALLALGGGQTPLVVNSTGFRSESSRRLEAAQSGFGAVTAGPTRAGEQFLGLFRGLGQRVGLVGSDAGQDLQGAVQRQAAGSIGQQVQTALDSNPEDGGLAARQLLEGLGFSSQAGPGNTPSQIDNILQADSDGNIQVNRDLISQGLQVSRVGSSGASGNAPGLSFAVSVTGSSQASPLGSVSIGSDGQIRANGNENLGLAGIATGLQAERSNAAATALDAQVRSLGLNNLRVGSVNLDDAGDIRSITVQGGRELSVAQFADEISRGSGQTISTDAVRDVGRNGFRANRAAEAVGGSFAFTNSLRTGGSEKGFNQAVVSALDNLKANGIDIDNAQITSDGNDGVVVRIGNAQPIAISKTGAITVGGTALDATGTQGDAARSALAGLVQTNQTSNPNLSAQDRVSNIVTNGGVLQNLANSANDAFGGFLGAQTKQVTATFDSTGQINGANIQLNDGSAVQLGLNARTGQVGIAGFQNAEGRSGPATGKAIQLVTNLRQNGIGGNESAPNGGIRGILGDLGASGIEFTNRDNTRTLQRDDKNAFNNRFDQEGRVRFTLGAQAAVPGANGAADTPANPGVAFDLGIAFDQAGGVSLNTENLSSGQKAAITAAINKGRPADQQLGEPEALLAFSRSFGAGQVGLGSIQNDQGQIIANGDLNAEQRQNRTNYVGQIRDAENATIEALTTRVAGEGGRVGAVERGANVRFASLNVRALLGDGVALGLVGDEKIANQTNQQRSEEFLGALATAADTSLPQAQRDQALQKAQGLLDQALVASGLQAGSIQASELIKGEGSNAADFDEQGVISVQGALNKFGSVDVQVGFDGRSAQINATNISVQGAAPPGGTGPRAEDRASFTVTQNADGTRSISVAPGSSDAASPGAATTTSGINRDRLQAAVTEQLPTNEKTGTEKVGDALNSITGYLGVGLEAALPGLQALKKALEDMEEARIRLEAAKKQFAAALDYAQKIGLTYGHSTGGDPATSIIAEGHVLGDMIDGAGQSLDGFVNGLNDFLKFGNGSDDNDTGGAGGADAPPVGSLLAQQDGQAQLLQMVSSDANFANIAVLLGQNPGLLIQQAQQMDMLEQLANVIDQLQSPFGNPVQEMQRFVEQLQQRQSEGMVPADGMQVLGG